MWLGGNNCPGLKLPGLKPVADDQLLKFTQDGKFVLQIGGSNQSKGNTDTKNVHRAADVILKERRKLIVVPRETPWNLIQARNVVALLEAGAVVLPAIPSFYSNPKNVNDVVDTVVWRILDQLGLPNPRAFRWQSETAGPPRS